MKLTRIKCAHFTTEESFSLLLDAWMSNKMPGAHSQQPVAVLRSLHLFLLLILLQLGMMWGNGKGCHRQTVLKKLQAALSTNCWQRLAL